MISLSAFVDTHPSATQTIHMCLQHLSSSKQKKEKRIHKSFARDLEFSFSVIALLRNRIQNFHDRQRNEVVKVSSKCYPKKKAARSESKFEEFSDSEEAEAEEIYALSDEEAGMSF